MNFLSIFQHEETVDPTDEENEIKKQALTFEKSDKIAFELPSELISSEEIADKTLSSFYVDDKGVNDEWANVEFENIDEQDKTYYQVNNNENSNEEDITHDLTNDIAINQMLADQGASYNPDAEFFDISQYQPEGYVSSQENKEPPQESIDYLPYPNIQTSDKQSTTK